MSNTNSDASNQNAPDDQPVWVESPVWKMQDLDGKSVLYRIRVKHKSGNLIPHEGWGKFNIRRNPKGLLRIDIEAEVSRTLAAVKYVTYFAPQECVGFIQRNPNSSESDFTLFQF